MDMTTFSRSVCFWRRCRRRRIPKIAKTTRARPPITPPAIAPTGAEFFTGVDVLETLLVVADEDPDVVVVDGSVPFWITR